MPPTILTAVLLVSAATALVVWIAAATVAPERRRAVANLQRGIVAAAPPPAADAAPGVTVQRARASLGRSLTARPLVAMLERQHVRAGRPAAWPVERLLTLKLLWVPVGVLLVFWAVGSDASPALVAIALVGAVVVYFVPDLLLLSRGQDREKRIQLELADTLDQMTIAVEAGMGFDGAMARAAANGKGALADELTRTLQDMRMGRSRRQALEDLAGRTSVVDLGRFVRAILQADAYGISIGDVLRTQAAEMRLKRRQRAEEKAQKVPVLVLMPLMLCILPVLFIVIMTPVVIDMIGAFAGN
jgi:tight adherence protein C